MTEWLREREHELVEKLKNLLKVQLLEAAAGKPTESPNESCKEGETPWV
jgi:hypothetical protein